MLDGGETANEQMKVGRNDVSVRPSVRPFVRLFVRSFVRLFVRAYVKQA